jgi:hypothetical protein
MTYTKILQIIGMFSNDVYVKGIGILEYMLDRTFDYLI